MLLLLPGIREANPIARALFERGYAYKKAALEAGDLSGGRFGPFWDRLVFSKIRAKVGGEVKYMTTGGCYWATPGGLLNAALQAVPWGIHCSAGQQKWWR